MLLIEAAAAKTAKFGVPESGDTVEVVERPGGGITLIMADGQTSGHAAKAISNMVVRKAASLVLEGVRDGAAARAASDYLYTARRGRVSADLIMLSVDLQSRTLVVTRNSACPVMLSCAGNLRLIAEPSSAIGLQRTTRPSITEIPLAPGLAVLAFSDGIWAAGAEVACSVPSLAWLEALFMPLALEPTCLVESVLEEAVRRDAGRPRDDMTVLALAACEAPEERAVRRLRLSLPVGH
jgi:serine phosphatase RsbU (regulator of sigma subunit)